MKHATEILEEFGVIYEAKVVSAHRTPDTMYEYAETAKNRGIKCIIAGAGGAAHLPGMIASKTEIPVLGVPVHTKYLKGKDSLISIVQMPKGIPVATFAIGEAGASNAALFAISVISNNDQALSKKLLNFRETQRKIVLKKKLK
jgi:5-(carboxyamino)imidazole ribonucleotide mutase